MIMEKIIKSKQAKIWTTSKGEGIALLLFNGGPGCDDYLAPVSKMLEDHCQVIRFEPRGCGRSDWDSSYDVETTIDDAEEIRKSYGINKWIVVGHSAGPDLALAYTLKYPQNVLGIIGIAGGRIVNDREWSRDYKKNRVEIGEDDGGLKFNADPEVNKVGNHSWRQFIKRPSLLSDIAKVSVPAIFINAENDIRPNWPTKQLAGLIPKGEYREIPKATHYIWLKHANELEVELERAINLIIDYLPHNKEFQN